MDITEQASVNGNPYASATGVIAECTSALQVQVLKKVEKSCSRRDNMIETEQRYRELAAASETLKPPRRSTRRISLETTAA